MLHRRQIAIIRNAMKLFERSGLRRAEGAVCDLCHRGYAFGPVVAVRQVEVRSGSTGLERSDELSSDVSSGVVALIGNRAFSRFAALRLSFRSEEAPPVILKRPSLEVRRDVIIHIHFRQVTTSFINVFRQGV